MNTDYSGPVVLVCTSEKNTAASQKPTNQPSNDITSLAERLCCNGGTTTKRALLLAWRFGRKNPNGTHRRRATTALTVRERESKKPNSSRTGPVLGSVRIARIARSTTMGIALTVSDRPTVPGPALHNRRRFCSGGRLFSALRNVVSVGRPSCWS